MMRPVPQLGYLLLPVLLAVAACSDGTPTGPTTAIIDSEGGTVTLAGGVVTLTFPKNAVAGQVTISVLPTMDFPDSSAVVGGTVFRFLPEEIEFEQPVQVTIGYEPDSLPAGADEVRLMLHVVAGNKWESIPESAPDITNNTVTGTVGGFSVLGVLWAPPATSG